MMFWENVRLALTSLKTNKSRTFLTMLGIIIGIAAVIAIETVGNSLTLSLSDSMQSLGANNITVYLDTKKAEKDERDNGIVFGTIEKTASYSSGDFFTNEMLYNLVQEFPDSIEAISISKDVQTTVVKKGTSSKNLSVSGVSMGYFKANSVTFLSGKLFTTDEYKNGRNVIIIGSDVVDALYDGNYNAVIGEPISMTLSNQDAEFIIGGVYQYEQSMFGMASGSAAYIPLPTAEELIHSRNYTNFSVVAGIGVDANKLSDDIEDYLNGYYRNNDFLKVSTYCMANMVSSLSNMMGKVTTAISVVAGIALLVGGIGVMNIMLVSITERTREIGTRKALGATNGYIRMQFIIEAVVICVIGGALGIITGLIMGFIGANILGFAASPSVNSILGSIAFSMAIGVFFGYYPANKAAKMNPIEALRYE